MYPYGYPHPPGYPTGRPVGYHPVRVYPGAPMPPGSFQPYPVVHQVPMMHPGGQHLQSVPLPDSHMDRDSDGRPVYHVNSTKTIPPGTVTLSQEDFKALLDGRGATSKQEDTVTLSKEAFENLLKRAQPSSEALPPSSSSKPVTYVYKQ
jgi:hypothetical protein